MNGMKYAFNTLCVEFFRRLETHLGVPWEVVTHG